MTSWVRDGWGYRATSLDNLMTAISRIGTLTPGRRYVWRGVADWTWDVHSSIQRFILDHAPRLDHRSAEDVRALELAFVQMARDRGLDEAGQMSEQAVIASLQHHGIPTRYLDVTSDPMTALWFATDKANDSGRDASGAVFAFDVTAFRSLPTAGRIPATWSSLGNPDWHYQHELSESLATGLPFIVSPTVRDSRMTAQQGLFIAGPPSGAEGATRLEAFELRAPPPGHEALRTLFATNRKRGRPAALPFVVLVVPSNLKNRLRTHLETTYSRSHATLFPDLAGYAAFVARNRGAAVGWADEVRSIVRAESERAAREREK